jgi:putative peptidoglycan lipid II flippase
MREGDTRLIRAAGSMSAMTALSRVAGYVRDNLQAHLMGAGFSNSSDAFVIAFRIPNLLRRLVAEGALTSAFVPTLARSMKKGDMEGMWRFVGSVWYSLTALLVGIVLFGVLFSPVLVQGLAWGYADQAGKFDLTVVLNRWMWPYIFFISLSALAGGILNVFGRFALPAFTPVLLNLAIIVCALTLRHRFPDPAFAFAVGVLVGGVLQLLVQMPTLIRLGFPLRPPRPFDAAGVREVARLMLPRILGAGITQINLVVDSQFATSLRAGSASFLYYASRVTELTLGIFGISLSTVILPSLSRAAADGDRERVLETLAMAVRLLIFITLPATLGLIVLRTPIIHLLFERGRFTAEDTLLTSSALACYSVGLLPYAAVNVLAAAFYAHGDTRTPVKIGLATFFLHLGLNFALRGPLAHAGIALSTSISAFVDAILLALILRRRVGEFLGRRVRKSAARAALCGAAMTGALLAALQVVDVPSLPSLGLKALALSALIGVGMAVYLAGGAALGSEEIRLMRQLLTRRKAGER